MVGRYDPTPEELAHQHQLERLGHRLTRTREPGQVDYLVSNPLRPADHPKKWEFKHLSSKDSSNIASKIEAKNRKIAAQLRDPRFDPAVRLSINGAPAGHSLQAMRKGLDKFLQHPGRKTYPSMLREVELFGCGPGGAPVRQRFGAEALRIGRVSAVGGIGKVATQSQRRVAPPPLKGQPVSKSTASPAIRPPRTAQPPPPKRAASAVASPTPSRSPRSAAPPSARQAPPAKAPSPAPKVARPTPIRSASAPRVPIPVRKQPRPPPRPPTGARR